MTTAKPEARTVKVRAVADAYDKGFRDGIAAFVHWEGGVRCVGAAGGVSLDYAIKSRRENWAYAPPDDRMQISERVYEILFADEEVALGVSRQRSNNR